jgi:hypothetical protein
VGVDARAAGLVHRVARHGSALAEPLDDRGEMRGRRAAAPADDVQAELGDEALVRVGEAVGGEVVVGVAVDHRREARVREARQERARVL